MPLPLLALRTATLVGEPLDPFNIELQIRFDADAGTANLVVAGYASLSAEQRPHAEHLARHLLSAGGWRRRASNLVSLASSNAFGWTWTTTHARFNSHVAQLHVANNRPGPKTTFYRPLRFSQETYGDGRSQLVQYVYRAF